MSITININELNYIKRRTIYMSKKIYKLSDIEKILTYTPPVFLLILSVISIFITYLTIEHQQNSELKLLAQKQQFFKQKQLDKFIVQTNQKNQA